MKLSLIPWYYKALAALALCVALQFSGWFARGVWDQSKRAAELERDARALAAAQDKTNQANERLIRELEKPKAGVEIREVVRNNPSQCVLPKPVFDGLLDSIRKANAAR